MNNNERAARAQVALDAYAEAKGEERDESDLTDLLSDLFHLVGPDAMQDRMQTAAMHFASEADEAKSGGN